jgi:hypothetical protein
VICVIAAAKSISSALGDDGTKRIQRETGDSTDMVKHGANLVRQQKEARVEEAWLALQPGHHRLRNNSIYSDAHHTPYNANTDSSTSKNIGWVMQPKINPWKTDNQGNVDQYNDAEFP